MICSHRSALIFWHHKKLDLSSFSHVTRVFVNKLWFCLVFCFNVLCLSFFLICCWLGMCGKPKFSSDSVLNKLWFCLVFCFNVLCLSFFLICCWLGMCGKPKFSSDSVFKKLNSRVTSIQTVFPQKLREIRHSNKKWIKITLLALNVQIMDYCNSLCNKLFKQSLTYRL